MAMLAVLIGIRVGDGDVYWDGEYLGFKIVVGYSTDYVLVAIAVCWTAPSGNAAAQERLSIGGLHHMM
jgi:hypothetical protein